jgi:uncharacterized coiled-coil protein SlyX
MNFGDGARVKAENHHSSRERIAELDWIAQVQEARIEELADALARHNAVDHRV